MASVTVRSIASLGGMAHARRPIASQAAALLRKRATAPVARSMSSLPSFDARAYFRLSRPKPTTLLQRRAIAIGRSQNLLAHMENTANNNPTSATAQNAFYAALLHANMPAIIVERYQTGRYATSPACQDIYVKALERLGMAAEGAAIGDAAGQAQGQQLNNTQLQAIGQAVAAQVSGGNVSMAKNKQGTGAKDSPLYVVVDESLGSTIFKWVRFLLFFGVSTYIALVIVTLIIETTGVLKRVGGMQNNQAQPQQQKTRFSDVHGCDEAKEELQELVDFLKNPSQFSTLGGKLPKGVLLMGPPGTGKTLLARAVAGEAGVPFFFMSGSEFDEVYVGVGAKRIRELFAQAREKAPSIVFIDELDAVGGKRNERDAAYVKQTLNQLLTELDGFSQDAGVIIIGATNFPQSLDKALTRPGRFDRHVNVPLPDVRGRLSILKYHTQKVPIQPDIDISVIARQTPGFSGADLENLVNQAAVRASKNKAKSVSLLDFDWAKDKILMGAEARSRVIQDKDRRMTAYHEGAHALVAMFTDGADPVYKATIMPRGPTLGVTYQLPEMDKVSQSKKEMLAHIDVCMAGKIAEELIYGSDNVTSGASSVGIPTVRPRPELTVPQDIHQATRIAYTMVTEYGFSDKLGDVDLASRYKSLSADTKELIEAEVRRLIEEGRARATKLLTERRSQLDLIANALVEYEVLNLEEMQKVLRGEKLPKLTAAPAAPVKLPELPELAVPPGLGGSRNRDAADGAQSQAPSE